MPKNIASEDITISENYSELERKSIAKDIIEHLRKRTKSGKGEGLKPWPGSAGKYSKSYKESLDFKLKASKSPVNLTLSGDMLTAIEVLQNRKSKIQVGIPFGASEWGRAKGNILGSYGGNPNPSKARPFLKLSKKEIDNILSKYPLQKKKREKNLKRLEKLAPFLTEFKEDKK